MPRPSRFLSEQRLPPAQHRNLQSSLGIRGLNDRVRERSQLKERRKRYRR